MPDKDATQRVRLDSAAARSRARRRRARVSKREKITLAILGTITVLLVIAVIFAISSLFAPPEDDGLILKGVVAAGVNLGGMTPEEATQALQEATAETYSKLDMSVSVLDTQILLSPKVTGAKLDVAAVVQDAYNYGRTGSRSEREHAKNYALTNSVIIPITSHLNLDTDYIRSEINKLGEKFSSALNQPNITVEGVKPSMNVTKPNVHLTHQTLKVFVGTPEYGLDVNKLYAQVLEYYNINIFQVEAVCTVVAPDTGAIEEELLTYYESLCLAPVDAKINPSTYEVIPEIYGYGFNMDEAKQLISKAAYGTTVEIPLRYMAPNITAELIHGNLFKNTLGDFSTPLKENDPAWNHNATLACQKLNGLILKSGDVFSFNQLMGELTASKGFMEAMAAQGKFNQLTMGGGIAHAASVLYNSVLEAELEIIEQHNHVYAVDFIEVGRDVYVNKGTADFRFRNSLPDPIRIDARVVNNTIEISIVGTDSRDYRVEIETKYAKTILPELLSNFMVTGNPGGYMDGQLLVAPIIGYDVELVQAIYGKNGDNVHSRETLMVRHYDARDSVIIVLKDPTPDIPSTDPTEPSVPENPTNPTYPSDPTNPSDSTDPSKPGNNFRPPVPGNR